MGLGLCREGLAETLSHRCQLWGLCRAALHLESGSSQLASIRCWGHAEVTPCAASPALPCSLTPREPSQGWSQHRA